MHDSCKRVQERLITLRLRSGQARFLALFLALALAVPYPAFAMRQTELVESGLEQRVKDALTSGNPDDLVNGAKRVASAAIGHPPVEAGLESSRIKKLAQGAALVTAGAVAGIAGKTVYDKVTAPPIQPPAQVAPEIPGEVLPREWGGVEPELEPRQGPVRMNSLHLRISFGELFPERSLEGYYAVGYVEGRGQSLGWVYLRQSDWGTKIPADGVVTLRSTYKGSGYDLRGTTNPPLQPGWVGTSGIVAVFPEDPIGKIPSMLSAPLDLIDLNNAPLIIQISKDGVPSVLKNNLTEPSTPPNAGLEELSRRELLRWGAAGVGAAVTLSPLSELLAQAPQKPQGALAPLADRLHQLGADEIGFITWKPIDFQKAVRAGFTTVWIEGVGSTSKPGFARLSDQQQQAILDRAEAAGLRRLGLIMGDPAWRKADAERAMTQLTTALLQRRFGKKLRVGVASNAEPHGDPTWQGGLSGYSDMNDAVSTAVRALARQASQKFGRDVVDLRMTRIDAFWYSNGHTDEKGRTIQGLRETEGADLGSMTYRGGGTETFAISAAARDRVRQAEDVKLLLMAETIRPGPGIPAHITYYGKWGQIGNETVEAVDAFEAAGDEKLLGGVIIHTNWEQAEQVLDAFLRVTPVQPPRPAPKGAAATKDVEFVKGSLKRTNTQLSGQLKNAPSGARVVAMLRTDNLYWQPREGVSVPVGTDDRFSVDTVYSPPNRPGWLETTEVVILVFASSADVTKFLATYPKTIGLREVPDRQEIKPEPVRVIRATGSGEPEVSWQFFQPVLNPEGGLKIIGFGAESEVQIGLRMLTPLEIAQAGLVLPDVAAGLETEQDVNRRAWLKWTTGLGAATAAGLGTTYLTDSWPFGREGSSMMGGFVSSPTPFKATVDKQSGDLTIELPKSMAGKPVRGLKLEPKRDIDSGPWWDPQTAVYDTIPIDGVVNFRGADIETYSWYLADRRIVLVMGTPEAASKLKLRVEHRWKPLREILSEIPDILLILDVQKDGVVSTLDVPTPAPKAGLEQKIRPGQVQILVVGENSQWREYTSAQVRDALSLSQNELVAKIDLERSIPMFSVGEAVQRLGRVPPPTLVILTEADKRDAQKIVRAARQASVPVVSFRDHLPSIIQQHVIDRLIPYGPFEDTSQDTFGDINLFAGLEGMQTSIDLLPKVLAGLLKSLADEHPDIPSFTFNLMGPNEAQDLLQFMMQHAVPDTWADQIAEKLDGIGVQKDVAEQWRVRIPTAPISMAIAESEEAIQKTPVGLGIAILLEPVVPSASRGPVVADEDSIQRALAYVRKNWPDYPELVGPTEQVIRRNVSFEAAIQRIVQENEPSWEIPARKIIAIALITAREGLFELGSTAIALAVSPQSDTSEEWLINYLTADNGARTPDKARSLILEARRLVHPAAGLEGGVTRREFLKHAAAAAAIPQAKVAAIEQSVIQAARAQLAALASDSRVREALEESLRRQRVTLTPEKPTRDVTNLLDRFDFSKRVREAGYDVNQAKALIFSTSIEPAAAVLPRTLKIFPQDPQWRETLKSNLARLRELGWKVEFSSTQEEADILIGDDSLIPSSRQVHLQVTHDTVRYITAVLLLNLQNQGRLQGGETLIVGLLLKGDFGEAVLIFA